MSAIKTSDPETVRSSTQKVQPGIPVDWKITQDLWGAAKAQVLMAGVELDVFSAIHAGNSDATQIARVAGAAEASTRRLLDALVACGYLHKDGNRYRIEEEAVKFLVRGEAHYMGAAVKRLRAHWELWGKLTEAVRQGKSIRKMNQLEDGGSFFAEHVQAIFPSNLHAAQNLVRALPREILAKVSRVFDIGCGAGAWGIAFATSLAHARVTAIDFSEVIAIAKTYVQEFGVENQFELIEGDFTKLEFPRESFDLVTLGYVLHNEGISGGRELIRRSCEALRPGGWLLIADIVADDDRTGPLIPVLFGLNMMVLTEHGDVFTEAETNDALRYGGFSKIQRMAAPSQALFLLAQK